MGWPERGSRIKPIYCLGDPAFWAGALCIAGVAGNASRGAYGARGQPGEGEYLDGLSDGGAASQAMDGKGLRLVTVEVNGREGVFKGYLDGAPARVPSFVSQTTPGLGLAQLGGSSSSRTRRFHGLIAEVVHYNRLLSQREIIVPDRRLKSYRTLTATRTLQALEPYHAPLEAT